jgi:uncharacterized protein
MEKLYKAVHALFEPYQPLGHDIKHALRTAALAKQIAKDEGYDEKEAEAAGLLHDVGRTVKDSKIPHGHEGAPIAKKLLDAHTDFSDEAKTRIVDAVYIHSKLTTEGKLNNILQDADKLDGLGTIGISRAYMTHYNKIDYDPSAIIPTSATYGKTKSAHEQIRLQMNWYSMLYTETAKKIGKPRLEFMQKFLEEFKREVEESI